MAFHFRCISNRNGPLFSTTEAWEAADFRLNPEYEELNDDGELVQPMDTGAGQRIPMRAPQEEAPVKRKTLSLPKKA